MQVRPLSRAVSFLPTIAVLGLYSSVFSHTTYCHGCGAIIGTAASTRTELWHPACFLVPYLVLCPTTGIVRARSPHFFRLVLVPVPVVREPSDRTEGVQNADIRVRAGGQPVVSVPGKLHDGPGGHSGPFKLGYERHAAGVEAREPVASRVLDTSSLQVSTPCVKRRHRLENRVAGSIVAQARRPKPRHKVGRDWHGIGPLALGGCGLDMLCLTRSARRRAWWQTTFPGPDMW